MHKIYCIIFLRGWVLFHSYDLHAVSRDFNWTKGEVILADSGRLKGELSVNYPLDLLLFKKDGRIRVYPAHKVKSFVLFDQHTAGNRRFISRQYQSARGLKGQVFFEIVVFGPLNILRREKKYHRLGPQRSLPFEYADYAFTESKTEKYVYYVLNGSDVTDLITFQKELSGKVFADYRQQVDSFIKQKGLIVSKHGDFAQLIALYNALKLRDQSVRSKITYVRQGF